MDALKDLSSVSNGQLGRLIELSQVSNLDALMPIVKDLLGFSGNAMYRDS